MRQTLYLVVSSVFSLFHETSSPLPFSGLVHGNVRSHFSPGDDGLSISLLPATGTGTWGYGTIGECSIICFNAPDD